MSTERPDKRRQEDITHELSDHAELIHRVQELTGKPEYGFKEYLPGDATEINRFLTREEDAKKKTRNMLLAEDTAVELGSPGCISASSLLWTKKRGVVNDGIWISSSGIDESNGRSSHSYAQLIMVELEKDADPTDTKLQNVKNLTNRIPGYMTRIVPGKIWIRISKELKRKGFNLLELARCLTSTYREKFHNIQSFSAVLAAGDPAIISELTSISEQARVITHNNKKRRLGVDGSMTCGTSNCASCSDGTMCDTVNKP